MSLFMCTSRFLNYFIDVIANVVYETLTYCSMCTSNYKMDIRKNPDTILCVSVIFTLFLTGQIEVYLGCSSKGDA